MTQNQTYITPNGFVKLKDELDRLINIERKNIAARIQEAKELGDLSENAEYSTAKDEQAFLEMRIVELQGIIKNAIIINEQDHNHNEISVGSTIEFEDEVGNCKNYQLVGSHEANPSLGKISNESPIGRAFLGKKQGDLVEFKAPKGMVKFKILHIK
jgi:transcription elongation factor GreA